MIYNTNYETDVSAPIKGPAAPERRISMSQSINRRGFIKKSLLSPAAGALAMQTAQNKIGAAGSDKLSPSAPISKATVPKGKIGNLEIGRLLLGGNLLTHYTHSRDLRYVYNLTAHYNTEEKIIETMRIAEAHGIDTLVIHTAPGIVSLLKKYRYRLNGKIKWIICPTAQVDSDPEGYAKLIQLANPNWVELKAYMFIGHSRERLELQNMPLHKDIKKFANKLAKILNWKIIDERPESRVVLLAKNDSKTRFLNQL